MRFEISIVKKYLIPQRGGLSRALVSFLSVLVISLVVWLILLFLSVTEGIESAWLKKLTTLNAPLQLTPTEAYYASYYYQIDQWSHSSDYQLRSLREKHQSGARDPFSPEEDGELPLYFPPPLLNPDGSLKDLVGEAFQVVEKVAARRAGMSYEEYEMSGSIVNIQMIRETPSSYATTLGSNYLTQVCYLSSFSEKNPELPHLVLPPTMEDLNHLFFLANLSPVVDPENRIDIAKDTPFQQKVASLLHSLTIHTIHTSSSWQIPSSFLPEHTHFDGYALKKGEVISRCILVKQKKRGEEAVPSSFIKGQLSRVKGELLFLTAEGETFPLTASTPLYLQEPFSMKALFLPSSLEGASSLEELTFQVSFTLQGTTLSGEIPWKGVQIEQADVHTSFSSLPNPPPPWPYLIEEGEKRRFFLPDGEKEKAAIILPKSFQTSGVRVGDIGYFSYGAQTVSALQEQRLPFYVSGFYDPGMMMVGVKALLTSSETVATIRASSHFLAIDPLLHNGVHIWVKDLGQTKEVVQELKKELQKEGLLPYFTITPFYEYEFVKDLLLQFQSDKALFTLVGVIMLMVACSNIISLLIILVNDKKREIAILSAMGTSKKSIALIFMICGGTMGFFSALIGTMGAFVTLRYIDQVANFLSFVQGRKAFNALFYGHSLPNELSMEALLFILIATPTISLLAGWIPAMRATQVHPSQVLRSE